MRTFVKSMCRCAGHITAMVAATYIKTACLLRTWTTVRAFPYDKNLFHCMQPMERQRTVVRGFLSRLAGSQGFQLINVSDAAIVLKGHDIANRLVNRVTLVNELWGLYSWRAFAQARKVCYELNV